MRSIAVFRYHPIHLNDQLGGKRIGKLPMDQQIGHHFSKNLVPEADSPIPFQIKGIIEVFRNKLHQPFIALQQIYPDIIAVIIAIQIDPAQNRISAMMGQRRQNQFIISKNKNPSKGNPFLSALTILQIQPGTF